MTIKLLANADLMNKIGQCRALVVDFNKAFAQGGLIHETACEALLFIKAHGDVTACQRLYEALGGSVNRSLRSQTDRKTLIKAEAVAMWFLQMSGKQITVRKSPNSDERNWALTDRWNRSDEFWAPLLEQAEKTPIMEYAQEERQVIRTVYVGQILNQIDNFLNNLEENKPWDLNVEGEKPRFAGDPEVSLSALRDIRDFAHKRLEQEKAQDIGAATVGNVIPYPDKKAGEADSKLLREGEEVVPESVPQAAVG